MTVQHFLTLKDLPGDDLLAIIHRATELKRDPSLGVKRWSARNKLIGEVPRS